MVPNRAKHHILSCRHYLRQTHILGLSNEPNNNYNNLSGILIFLFLYYIYKSSEKYILNKGKSLICNKKKKKYKIKNGALFPGKKTFWALFTQI